MLYPLLLRCELILDYSSCFNLFFLNLVYAKLCVHGRDLRWVDRTWLAWFLRAIADEFEP